MLALVERGGGEELVEVLRSLSEVSALSGRCREALDFIGRALRVAQEAGSEPGTGLVQRGHRRAGRRHASAGRRRTPSAGAARPNRSATPSTWAATCTRWARPGCAAATPAAASRRCAGSGRWSRPRASPSRRCCAGTATWPRAWSRSASWRRRRARSGAAREAVANRTHNAGVTARLDRAEALLRRRAGRAGPRGRPARRGGPPVRAARPTDRARAHAAGAGPGRAPAPPPRGGPDGGRRSAGRLQPDRRQAVGRTGRRGPWPGWTVGSEPERPAGARRTLAALTATEARIAAMVRDGASNREIATRMFLSVKTVEATLTRMYRKLGVRSRTQLSSRLGRARGESRGE